MSSLVFNLVTAALMVLMLRVALNLVDPETFRGRRFPWVAVALTALAIALLTVSIQTIRAAVANPIKSLRTQ